MRWNIGIGIVASVALVSSAQIITGASNGNEALAGFALGEVGMILILVLVYRLMAAFDHR